MHNRRRLGIAGLIAAGCSLVLASGASAAPAIPGQVIVEYRSDVAATAQSRVSDRAGVGRTLGKIRGQGAKLVAIDGDPERVAAELNRSDAVLYAEPNYRMRIAALPDDAAFGQLYGLHNSGQTGGIDDADIDAPEAWDAAGLATFPATGGVKIGIVDTGIDADHEDLAGKTVDCANATGADNRPVVGACADDQGHGSHVAGTAAGIANNGVGVAGVSPASQLSVCKALDAYGFGSTAAVANCISWAAAKGAKVISLSLGGPGNTTLRNAVAGAYAGGQGALVVAAAGNEGDGTANYPAYYTEAVSVAATDAADARARFSNVNDDVEIAAPGVDVLSVKLDGGYVAHSGTSMAAPHVAGAAAVVMGATGANAAQARAALTTGADDLGAVGRDPEFGFGRLNVANALRQIAPPVQPSSRAGGSAAL